MRDKLNETYISNAKTLSNVPNRIVNSKGSINERGFADTRLRAILVRNTGTLENVDIPTLPATKIRNL